MLWINCAGGPWRDLPERHGRVGTVSSRLSRWRAAGIWDRALSALQADADARGEADWDLRVVDAAVIRAPEHPAGAGGAHAVEGSDSPEALGRSQDGFSAKLHLRADGGGKPITAVLTAGERHEQTALEALLDQGAVRRLGRGRPRLRPRCVAGDTGYSSPTARGRLRRRHIRPVIPSKSNQRRQPGIGRDAYRRRNRIERLINCLKQFRRVATRYEKRGVNDLAMATLGMIVPWL